MSLRGPAAPDDAAGFADWVRPHVPLMSVVAARLVPVADVDDVVQESLVRAWLRRSTFDSSRGTVRGWLMAVLFDRARRARTRTPAIRPLTMSADGQAAAPSADRVDVERAVADLPRRQREVITLYYLADLGVDEVANVLGISSGSVKSALSDARAALRRSLEDAEER